MKRKLFITIIAVLILCLTCGMLMVACNKKNSQTRHQPVRARNQTRENGRNDDYGVEVD